MELNTEKLNVLLIDFIDLLKQNGFIVGVDQYIKLHLLLLNDISYEKEIEDIKYLICPVFANDQSQQRKFYDLFDRYFNVYKFSDENYEIKNHVNHDYLSNRKSFISDSKKFSYLAFGLVVLLLFIFPYVSEKKIFHSNFSLLKINVSDINYPNANGKSKLPDIQICIEISDKISDIFFYQTSSNLLSFFAVILPFLLFIFYEWYRSTKKNLIFQKQAKAETPYMIPLKIDAPPLRSTIKNKRYYNILKRLKQRADSDIYTFDVNQSIVSTIENAGFSTLKYRPITKPTEYLFLVDVPEIDNHYSRFINDIAYMLKNDGIYIKTFFYNYDPRKCYSKIGEQPISIFDIKSNYSNYRLILVGDCQSLINMSNNQIDQWTELFQSWKYRAILTYRHPSDWSELEIILSEMFFILPASIESFWHLADYFESSFYFQSINKDISNKMLSPHYFEQMPADVESLKNYFYDDAESFQWLCSCAVYPHIHWSLTLFLSSFQNMQLTEDKLLKLIRLPWFRSGIMPDELRIQLIGELQQQTLMSIRYAFLQILEYMPPPVIKNDVWFSYATIGISKIFASKRQKAYFKELKNETNKIKNIQTIKDYTSLSFVETGAISSTSFILPKKLSSLFLKKGLSFFDLRSLTNLIFSILLSITIFLLLPNYRSTHSVTMDFSYIPPGVFTMGSPINEMGRSINEKQHNVFIKNGFYIMKTEVTQKQWKAIMGNYTSHLKNDSNSYPVNNVSWVDVKEYIIRLNRISKNEQFRLPSEKEWEYACRAGTNTPLSNGELEVIGCEVGDNIDDIAWYCGNSKGSIHQVANKNPNLWGIYDMHGNVSEWCNDSYSKNHQMNSEISNYSTDNKMKVIRGGDWNSPAQLCRSAKRNFKEHDYRSLYVGFRLIKEIQ